MSKSGPVGPVGEVRYVLLTFDERYVDKGQVHPASTFLRRMEDDYYFKYDVGAVRVKEVAPVMLDVSSSPAA